MEITTQVLLPRSPECVAFSAEGQALLAGDRPFTDVQRPIAEALLAFHEASGLEGAVWLAAHRWRDRASNPAILVTLYMGTDGPASAEDIAAFTSTLQQRGPEWEPLGVHERPAEAFCSLYAEGGRVYQLWDRIFGEYVMYELSDGGLRVAPIPSSRYVPPPDALVLAHAEGEPAPENSPENRRRDQLKMAFALHFVQRIIEADGLVQEEELAFKKRVFPDHEVEELWLDDPALLERLAAQAETELATMLGYHEKLALIGAFFGACYADGKVDIRESKVVQEAATALGLTVSAVEGVLPGVW